MIAAQISEGERFGLPKAVRQFLASLQGHRILQIENAIWYAPVTIRTGARSTNAFFGISETRPSGPSRDQSLWTLVANY